MGWITTPVCVYSSLLGRRHGGVRGAAGCQGVQHGTGLNESVSSDPGKQLLWLVLGGEALKSQVLLTEGRNGKHEVRGF